MADQLIGSPSDLSTAGQLGIGMQEKQIQQKAQTQDQIQQDTALPQQAAAGALGQQMEKITITPEMAKGLKGVTGQDWDSAVGTKWDPKVFTPMVASMSQSKYHQDLLSDEDKRTKLNNDARQAKQDAEDKAKSDREDKALAAKQKLQDDRDAAAQAKQDKKDKQDSVEKKKEGVIKILDTISKAKDDDTRNTAIDAYNSAAKDVGLPAYKQSPGFIDQVKSMFTKGNSSTGNNSSGGDDKTASYLQKHNAKDTPANRKWAESQPDFGQ